MENEQLIRKLEAENIRLKNRNMILKTYLQILASSPDSNLAERIRFVLGKKTNQSFIQLN